MQVALELTESDVRAWMEFVLNNDRQFAESRRAIRLLVPLLTALVGFLSDGLLGTVVGFVFGVLLSVFFVPWAWRHQTDRRIEHAIAGLTDGLIGPQSIELSDSTIRWTTSAVDAVWQRSAIRQVERTDSHGFVMFSESSALIIPLTPDDDGHRRALLDQL